MDLAMTIMTGLKFNYSSSQSWMQAQMRMGDWRVVCCCSRGFSAQPSVWDVHKGLDKLGLQSIQSLHVNVQIIFGQPSDWWEHVMKLGSCLWTILLTSCAKKLSQNGPGPSWICWSIVSYIFSDSPGCQQADHFSLVRILISDSALYFEQISTRFFHHFASGDLSESHDLGSKCSSFCPLWISSCHFETEKVNALDATSRFQGNDWPTCLLLPWRPKEGIWGIWGGSISGGNT